MLLENIRTSAFARDYAYASACVFDAEYLMETTCWYLQQFITKPIFQHSYTQTHRTHITSQQLNEMEKFEELLL